MKSTDILTRTAKTTGTKVSCGLAANMKVDVGDAKYAVICDEHGSILGHNSIMFVSRVQPTEFCDGCRKLAAKKESPAQAPTMPKAAPRTQRKKAAPVKDTAQV